MRNFEQIRTHAVANYRVTSNEPYLLCIELSLSQGTRHQSLFLSEIEDEDERRFLRFSTAVAPITGLDAKRALRFNWESHTGYLAVSDLDGVPYLHLCENRPYAILTAAEIDRLILELGGVGDRMESQLSAGGDLL